LRMQGYRCAYCRINISNRYHLDHIVPVIRGGTGWPRNIQALCGFCNISKHGKDPIDYAQSRGFLL
jgi:5-methylcytosine-specific restriction endonuclease McrA